MRGCEEISSLGIKTDVMITWENESDALKSWRSKNWKKERIAKSKREKEWRMEKVIERMNRASTQANNQPKMDRRKQMRKAARKENDTGDKNEQTKQTQTKKTLRIKKGM